MGEQWKEHVDEKSKIIEELKRRASAYVPEWRFDEEHPDIGTALTLVYGDMMASIHARMGKMMEKSQIDFLNAIGADLTPAIPARGYVSFGLVNDSVSAVKVPAKTYVMADVENAENGMVSYETQDDILVSPAKLSCMYEVSEKNDYIGLCYQEGQGKIEQFLFQRNPKNLQEHEIYIGQKEVLQATSAAKYTLSLTQYGMTPVGEELLRFLLNPDYAEISYSTSTEGVFEPFAEKTVENGNLVLYRFAEQVPSGAQVIGGEENLWIRIRFHQIEPFRLLSIQKANISVRMEGIHADMVVADGMEADLHRYYPFGEKLSLYSEVYFVSDEVLSKKGAEVELCFYLQFDAIPLDTNQEETDIKLNWIMNESDFEKVKEYDVTIEHVVWEYYNGSGWVRLYKDNTNEDVFQFQRDHYVKIKFQCPEDMEKAYLSFGTVYAIRGRITKLNNPYKLQGQYRSPVLQNTIFYCDYAENPVEQLSVWGKHNMELKKWTEGQFQPFLPSKSMQFAQLSQSSHQAYKELDSLYLGFQVPPKGGPIKLFFRMEEAISVADVSLQWEYWNGKAFQPLHVIDETMGFTKSGLVTFIGAEDFACKKLFEKEQYWIRISERNNAYNRQSSTASVPLLKEIIINTVKVVNRQMAQTEYFQMEYCVKHKKFHLQRKSIQEVQVYVKDSVIGNQEQEWEQWERVSDFLESKDSDKHYIINQNEGYIQFGDGERGKIPPVGRTDNIKVIYQCGDGLCGNVEKGQISKLSTNIGFINQIWNPEELSGGIDMETRERAIKRCSEQIRLRNRAITKRDYESMAYVASRRIEKARCFTGMDGEGNPLYGAITLVLLLKDYQVGSSVFQSVCNTVKDYVVDKMPEGVYHSGKLFVIEPVFIIFQVNVELVVKDVNQVFAVQKEVEEKMDTFFHPIKGNFDHAGWTVGMLPNAIQTRNMIHLVKGVEEINSLFLTAYRNGTSGFVEVDLEEMKQNPYVLPVSGKHQVNVIWK